MAIIKIDNLTVNTESIADDIVESLEENGHLYLSIDQKNLCIDFIAKKLDVNLETPEHKKRRLYSYTPVMNTPRKEDREA